MKTFLIRLSIVFLTAFSAFVQAKDEVETTDIAATEGLPNTIVNGSVCVITGEYIDQETDFYLPGPEPLVFHRFYSSLDRKSGNLCSNWQINHRNFIQFDNAKYKGEEVISFKWVQSSTSRITYTALLDDLNRHHTKSTSFSLIKPKGLTNGGSSEISGRTNLKNQKVSYYPENQKVKVVSSSGRKHFLERINKKWPAFFQLEERSNVGNSLYYTYAKDKPSLLKVEAKHAKTGILYSSLSFDLCIDQNLTSRVTSDMDDKKVVYHFLTKDQKQQLPDPLGGKKISYYTGFFLEAVENPAKPRVTFNYSNSSDGKWQLLSRKELPNERFLKTYYYRKGDFSVGKTNPDFDMGYPSNAPPSVLAHIEKKSQVLAHRNQSKIITLKKGDFRIDRAAYQSAPVGKDTTPIITHRFFYTANVNRIQDFEEPLSGSTDVFDAYLHKTTYTYSTDHRLTSLQRYSSPVDGKFMPYTTEKYFWDENKETENEGNLIGRVLMGERHCLWGRYYDYDKKGNIIAESFRGRLTGQSTPHLKFDKQGAPEDNGCEIYMKYREYSQDSLNLLTREYEDNGLNVFYGYKEGTDLLSQKLVFEKEELKQRFFYEYNSQGVMIRTIEDDGCTVYSNDLTGCIYRLETTIVPTTTYPIGLPQIIEEAYVDPLTKQKKQLRKSFFTYNTDGNPLAQQVFDANNELAYTLTWEYNAHGLVVCQTDAFNYSTIYSYDDNDNLIFKQRPKDRFYTTYIYDFANRLTSEIEHYEDGLILGTHHTYDYLNNRTSTTDAYGHTTYFLYDFLNRLTETVAPAIVDHKGQVVYPTTRTHYNELNLPEFEINALGGVTTTKYSSYGKPISVENPNGQIEKFYYHKDGKLDYSTDTTGKITGYAYNCFGKQTAQNTFFEGQLLRSQHWNYKGALLLSETDPEGHTTFYAYDGAKRLIEKRTAQTLQQLSYDALGRINCQKDWFGTDPTDVKTTFFTYDVDDQLLEEKIVDATGKILRQTNYTYDARGQKVATSDCHGTTCIAYNDQGKPCSITDAEGNQTTFSYDHAFINSYGQRVLQEKCLDPKGRLTTTTYNTQDNVVQLERRNAFGLLLSQTTYTYDAAGNQTRTCDAVVIDGQIQRYYINAFEYDKIGQLLVSIEGMDTLEQKRVSYVYNLLGQKISMTKADGITLFFGYDRLDRLGLVSADNGTVWDAFEYNLNDQIIQAKNYVANCTIQRAYNDEGQLIHENFGNSNGFSYQYDGLGRLTHALFPDQTGVSYLYDGTDLRETHRIKNGQRTYSHSYNTYDTAGCLLKETLACGTSTTYAYDALKRLKEYYSSYYKENRPLNSYDAAGNLIYTKIEDALGTKEHFFSYDENDQLISEDETKYKSDSLGNRLLKNAETYQIGAINQIVQQGNCQYTYDRNGNLTQKTENGEFTYFAYDAFDRLTEVIGPQGKTNYTYDPFHRRLFKVTNDHTTAYLYQGNNEIGSIDSDGKRELRILGLQTGSETGSAIAMELQDKILIPVHNPQGSLACLVDYESKAAIETHRYSAFGEELVPQSKNSLSPWRFCSKRVDQETGFVFFGRRYYAADVGRFVTPDPLGFADGPNMYAFLKNNPLLAIDLYGLFAESNGYHMFSGISHGFGDFMLSNFQSIANLAFHIGAEDMGFDSYEFSNAERYFLESQDRLTTKIESCMQYIIPADTSSEYYQTTRSLTYAGLEVMSIVGAGYGLAKGGVKYLANSPKIIGKVLQKFSKKAASPLSVNKILDNLKNATSGKKSTSLPFKSISTNKKTSEIARKIPGFSNDKIHRNPLEGIKFDDKVLDQMRLHYRDALPEYHSFPSIVENFAKDGHHFLKLQGDGTIRRHINLKGSYKGKEGEFEWIVDRKKGITHRLFMDEQQKNYISKRGKI